MSDSLRQDTSDKVASTLKPESQKSTLESANDSLKSAADSAASYIQPQGEKSTTQKATDALSSDNTNTSKTQQGEGLLAQAQEAIGNAAQQASHALGLDKKQ